MPGCALRGFRSRNRAADPQCLAAADDGVGIIRLQTQRGLERGNGVIELVELQQDLSEIAIDLGMRGLPADKLAVGIRRFCPGASHLQRLPELVPGRDHIGSEGDEEPELLHRRHVVTPLCRDRPEQVERLGMMRIDVEHLTVRALGFVKPVRLMQFERAPQDQRNASGVELAAEIPMVLRGQKSDLMRRSSQPNEYL